MDPLTHILSGVLAARAVTPVAMPAHSAAASSGRSLAPSSTPSSVSPPVDRIAAPLPPRMAMLAGGAAAIFPDIDFGLRVVGTLHYLNGHQGITHSLLMLPLWTVLLAWVFARLAGPRWRWRAFVVPVAAGLGIHIAGDLITAYGLQLLAPWSDTRWALSLAFVIAPWMSTLLVTGLVACAIWPHHARLAALLALGATVAYTGFLAHQRTQALAVGSAFATQSAQYDEAPIARAVHALPQPFSPFHWMVVVEYEHHYQVATLRLRGAAHVLARWSNIIRHYHPIGEAHWQRVDRWGPAQPTVTSSAAPSDAAPDSVAAGAASFAEAAWHRPEFEPFRRFARLPFASPPDQDETRFKGALSGEASTGANHASERCAWFVDLRFVLPAMPPSFRFGICRDDRGQWQMRRWRGAFWID